MLSVSFAYSININHSLFTLYQNYVEQRKVNTSEIVHTDEHIQAVCIYYKLPRIGGDLPAWTSRWSRAVVEGTSQASATASPLLNEASREYEAVDVEEVRVCRQGDRYSNGLFVCAFKMLKFTLERILAIWDSNMGCV